MQLGGINGLQLCISRPSAYESQAPARLTRFYCLNHSKNLARLVIGDPQLKEVIGKVKRQENYILTFVEYEKAESHNNFAEGIIRKGVLKRKVSGGSVSLDGAKAYCIILSIYQTCHLRELSFFGFLKTSLVDYIRTGEPMSLAQYEMEFGQISEKAS